MLVSELDYHLPEELIAQIPVEPRDSARLLVVHRSDGRLEHRHVFDLPALLRPDDLLIFNNTRVLKARLHGTRETGGRVEALLLKEKTRNLWECLLKPSARLKVDAPITFEGGGLSVTAYPRQRLQESWLVEFVPADDADVRDLLGQLGEVPLPPYIHEKSPEERYQTVFSAERPAEDARAHPLDSAAAPTAGLHFTPELLDRLKSLGMEVAFVTLAVGVGTFRPVQTERLEDHHMHTEEFWIPPATVAAIARQRARGGRVVAVGTTTVRALESVGREDGTVPEMEGETDIFIRPGYRFQVVDALITNFHLPKSTLLALVAAFVEQGTSAGHVSLGANASHSPTSTYSGGDSEPQLGLTMIRAAYEEAVNQRYRFFSFGDAMLIS